MEANTFLDAYAINTLNNRGVSIDKAVDIVNKRFLKLSYSTGAMEISQDVMIDENNNFYGIDTLGRLVTGSFIDEKYIVFYIINEDKSVTKFIGYNSVSHITLQFPNTGISTGMHIEEMATIDEGMPIEITYNRILEQIENQDPNVLVELLREIEEYQRYIEGIRTIQIKLGVKDEVPVIKELKA